MPGSVFVLLVVLSTARGDTNLLTGANDIIVARKLDGDLYATPFSVQFGKKDIWFPRSGHTVNLKLNGKVVPLAMKLDSEGHGYFSITERVQSKYRFWSALFGVSDPPPNQMTDTASADQLEKLPLQPGSNSIEFEVQTQSGSTVSTSANIFFVNSTQKFVVSDIDGTITRSDVRGFVLPTLGISDWKHQGIVTLYRKISDQGYMMIYLSSRAIGQSDSTREYLFNLREDESTLPPGPVLLYVDSVINALATEVIKGNPEVQKIAKLARVRGIFAENPLYSAYGNKDTDITAYKALNIPTDKIFRLNEESLMSIESEGIGRNITEYIRTVEDSYPLY